MYNLPMRIATWNIGGGFISKNNDLIFEYENWDYFVNQLNDVKPEIVCLQETHVSDEASQPKIIAKALGFDFEVSQVTAPSHLKNGPGLAVSIISKYPIVSSKFNLLPNPNLEFIWNGSKARSHDKGFIEATVDFKGTKIRVLSGHMVPFRKFGRDFMDDEFKQLRHRIENVILETALPEIVGADMNWPDIYAITPKIFEEGYKFILEDKPTTPKDRKYDKIIISKDWVCRHSAIVKGRADHYLCYADVDLLRAGERNPTDKS